MRSRSPRARLQGGLGAPRTGQPPQRRARGSRLDRRHRRGRPAAPPGKRRVGALSAVRPDRAGRHHPGDPVTTRFVVASRQFQDEYPVDLKKVPPQTPTSAGAPRDPSQRAIPPITGDVVLFIHGHSSSAEEAMPLVGPLLAAGGEPGPAGDPHLPRPAVQRVRVDDRAHRHRADRRLPVEHRLPDPRLHRGLRRRLRR